jgi:4-hydroxy-tetrahydrodipicolinate synthase
MKKIEGIIACVPTVFDDKRELDLDGFKENIRYLEDAGVQGIIAMHSVGEFYALNESEFNQVASAARDACDRMTCVIGCAYQNLREIVRRGKYADDIGADVALIFGGHYATYRSGDDQYESIRMVNDATKNIQLLQYDYPPEMKGATIQPNTIGRLLDFDRFAGLVTCVLSAPEGMGKVTEICRRYRDKISVLSITEPGLHLIMSIGGTGCIAPYGLAMPKLLLDYYNTCKTGDLLKSLKYYQKLTKYPWEVETPGMTFPGKASTLFPGQVQILTGYRHAIAARKTTWLWPGSVKTHKAVVEAAGRKAGPPRLPYSPASPALRKFAKNWLKDLGVL